MSRNKQEPPKRNAWFAELRQFVIEQNTERVSESELHAEEILGWADAHFVRTGKWPTFRSGVIPEATEESWMAVEAALSFGLRGLTGGSTLPQFLTERRARYNPKGSYRITENDILRWADTWNQRTGQWPRPVSEVIPDTPGYTWTCVDRALREGGNVYRAVRR
jgi:hypothetical protein